MKRLILVLVFLTLVGCAPQEPAKTESAPKPKVTQVGHFSTNWVEVGMNVLSAIAPLKSPKVPAFMNDDDRYTVIDHEWLKTKLRKHATDNRYKRAYQKDLKDCDNYALALYADIANQFAEEADAGSSQAMIGRLNVSLEPLDEGEKRRPHQVVMVRTNEGWFIMDPTRDLGLTLPTIQLVPVAEYKCWVTIAMF